MNSQKHSFQNHVPFLVFSNSVKALACALAVLGTTQGASAAAISGNIAESFDYGTGVQFTTAGGPNGGVGWNGNAWGAVNTGGNQIYRTATSPGLTFNAAGYFAGTGNKLTLDAATANQTQNAGRAFGQTINEGTTYFSLLMSKNNDTIRTINFAFFDGTTERFAVGQIATAAGNTAGNIGLLMNNSNPAGLIQNGTSPIAMGIGITHLIVGRIDWNTAGNESVTLWVDPTDVTSEGAAGAAYLFTSGFELTQLTGVRPFVGNTSAGFNAVSANFDEFRMGGDWVSVVPEPSTLTLAGLGAIGLVVAMRRRKA